MNRKNAIILLMSAGVAQVAYLTLSRQYTGLNKSIDDYKYTIEELSDIIIPRTDTPGAKDAGVYKFIIDVYNNSLSAKEQSRLLTGLENLDVLSRDKFYLPFEKCSKSEQNWIVLDLQKKLPMHPLLRKIRNKIWGPDFFQQIKALIVIGYCSSHIGATQGLEYDPIPNKYVPCIPYASGQRSWATK